MKKYDEYQKLMRYKYGYYWFNLLISLLALNNVLNIIFGFQWAETKEGETLLIMFSVMLYSIILSVYHNSYFKKNDDVKAYIWIFLITGIINLYSSVDLGNFELSNIFKSKISTDAVYTFGGLIWLAIPLTYFIRNAIDKRRERKNEY